MERGQPDSSRVEAIGELGVRVDRSALDVLLAIAGDETESEAVQAAAGAALASLYMELDQLLTAPLHDFTDAAYLAFDNAVAKKQAGQ